MNGRYRILLAIIILIIIWRSASYFSSLHSAKLQASEFDLNEPIEKVTVSVYYEALCPDSKFFITNQLLPVYEALPGYIELDLVPYGKAQTKEFNGEIVFQCQHDVVECEANKIHACVIEKVKEPLVRLKYISCMIIENLLPVEVGERCGRELGIGYAPIAECANSQQGSLLLKGYGERTHSLSPPVHFIPTIELNGSQTLVRQTLILKNLLKSVCQLLRRKPQSCI